MYRESFMIYNYYNTFPDYHVAIIYNAIVNNACAQVFPNAKTTVRGGSEKILFKFGPIGWSQV